MSNERNIQDFEIDCDYMIENKRYKVLYYAKHQGRFIAVRKRDNYETSFTLAEMQRAEKLNAY